MLLIKFGKKEHLEQLKKEIIHFSTLETFQKDPTSYRGDRLDGKILLDSRKPFIINGQDISSYIKEAAISYETDCPQLSFSAAMLSMKNCHKQSNDTYTINDSFVQEMQQFGDYFLLFNALPFIEALTNEFVRTQCLFEYHPLTYIDKSNHQLVQEHFARMSDEEKRFGHLFIKDTANSYPLQNEWRFITFDVHNCYHVLDDRGTNINTDFSTQMPVMETTCLHTLQCSEEFLFY